jgi:hypothetical protein
VFAPQSSLVKAAFQHCLPGWLTQPPVTAQTWRTDALRLEAEGRFVAMAFSPDDKYIATCSDNGIVRVWDPETGEHLSTSDTSGQDERLERCAALTFSGRNSLAKASFFLADHKEPGAALSYKIVIFQSIELRDTKEVTCAALGVYDAKLAFAPGDHDILYAAMNRRLDDIFAQDLWRLTIGLGTTERIWSRSKSISDDRDDRVWVFGVSAELGLVAYCSGDSNILDLVDLYSGASMRKLNLMSLAIHTGHSIFHGTGLIVAISDYEKWPPHGLHSFDVKTGQRCLVDSSSKSYEAFSMAHRGDRLALVLYNSASAEIRNISQNSKTEPTTPQNSLLDLTVSADGETLLVAYSDRFEVQTSWGGITFTRPAMWSTPSAPKISCSPNGTFAAARTCTDTGAHGISLWHIASGTEVFRPCATNGRSTPVFSHSGGLLAYDDEYSKRLIVWDTTGKTEALTFDMPQGISCPRTIQFEQDDKTLFTGKNMVASRMSLCIDNASGAWKFWPFNVVPPRMIRSRISYRELGWVEYDQEDLMWVPPQYRPPARLGDDCETSQSTIALWNSDTMVVMKIADPSR